VSVDGTTGSVSILPRAFDLVEAGSTAQ